MRCMEISKSIQVEFCLKSSFVEKLLLTFLIITISLDRRDLRRRVDQKSGTRASRLATREGRAGLGSISRSLPRYTAISTSDHSYCASLTHNRYIIFIIRTRDTRSRAGSYDAPVSVNRI